MKRAVAMLLAGMFAVQLCGPVFADAKADGTCDKSTKEQSAAKWQEKRLDKMAKELSLTADQKDKIAAIMKENGEKSKVSMQQVRDNMKAVRDATDQKVKAVLTPEQMKKYDTMQAERKEKMGKKMKGHHDGDEK